MREALLGLLLVAPALAAGRPFTLWVVDSRGQPADELAREVWRQTRHRQSRADFRWVRLGHPLPPSPVSPPATPPRPARGAEALEPEWDPEGAQVAAFGLEGLPRILLVDEAGAVRAREIFLPVADLRYLVRHPDSFPTSPAATRMGGASGPSGSREPTTPE